MSKYNDDYDVFSYQGNKSYYGKHMEEAEDEATDYARAQAKKYRSKSVTYGRKKAKQGYKYGVKKAKKTARSGYKRMTKAAYKKYRKNRPFLPVTQP